MISTKRSEIEEKMKHQLSRLLTFNINHVAHLMAKKVNRELVRSGYSLQLEQLPVLFTIFFYSDDLLSQQDIANLLQKDKSGIQRSLRTLERDGYLRVVPDSVDRRRNLVLLTPAGKMIVEKVLATSKEYDNRITAQLTEEEVETMLRLLNKISGLMNE